MFQYPSYFFGVLGVLLLGIQCTNAAESTITTLSSDGTTISGTKDNAAESTITTSSSDGTTITETKQTVPAGRFAQVTDGIKSSLAGGYDRANSISKGRLESMRTLALSQYSNIADRIKNGLNRQKGSASAACTLPTQTGSKSEQTIVQTTTDLTE